MSNSIHTTYADLKGLTKKELDEQYVDANSDLAKLGEKSHMKKEVKTTRKNEKIIEELKKKKAYNSYFYDLDNRLNLKIGFVFGRFGKSENRA